MAADMRLATILMIPLLAAAGANGAEPIRWFNGTWDETGAPTGKLLTDNPRWFGNRVFTGVSYEWETPPTDPKDERMVEGRTVCANRLLSRHPMDNDTLFVGCGDDGPIVAVFDFKRSCVFTEVDLLSAHCTNATGFVEFSEDKAEWHGRREFSTLSDITRVRVADLPRGRYMRLSFKATSNASGKANRTILDDVYAWGEGEVSADHPEAIVAIPPGDALLFANAAPDAVSILPMPIPRLNSKPSGATPDSFPLTMARNETESRYFAIVNKTGSKRLFSLSASEFGDGVRAELLVGGVMQISPPKQKLTREQMILLATTDENGINQGDPKDLDLIPFFFADARPEENFLRRYLANPAQVAGFPTGIPLASGEGCVVMLRLTSDDATPGKREGAISVCAASDGADGTSAPRPGATLPIPLTIVNLTLPPQSMWIYAYEPFTQQYPFESETRIRRDTERYIGIGATTTRYLPEPNTKEALFFDAVPNASVGCDRWCDRSLYKRVTSGQFDTLTTEERSRIQQDARTFLARARALGLSGGRVAVFLPDEPQPSNARSVMSLARLVKDAAPELLLHCDPLFYAGGGKGDGESPFYPPATIAEALLPLYNECIDISCPHSYLATPSPDHAREHYGEAKDGDGHINTVQSLMSSLWLHPRAINAMYCHPAGKTGREMVWRCKRFGFNGFAYYEYCHPNIDVWDINNWGVLNLNYQAVMPLGEDVALTALYESLREAAEDARLLEALSAYGRVAVLSDVLARSKTAKDRTGWHWKYGDHTGEDILALRETILGAFAGQSEKP